MMNMILTSLVISLFAAASIWAFERRDPGGKPWLTVLCLGVLLVLPVLYLLPKWHFEWLGSVSVGESRLEVMPWWHIAWLVGAVVMLWRVVCNHRALGKWVRESDKPDDPRICKMVYELGAMMQVRALPVIRIKSDLSSPVVVGLGRPVILLPEHSLEWSEDALRMAILHELGHVRRKDLLVRYAADVVCALHWWNPFVWWKRSKLHSQCEYACDAHVIAAGVDTQVYIMALCDVVEKAICHRRSEIHFMGVCAMVSHVPLQKRVARLTGESRAIMPWLAVTVAVVTTSTALGLSLMRPTVTYRGGNTGLVSQYSQLEINFRHSANPFPDN